jgi:hypothetical protein
MIFNIFSIRQRPRASVLALFAISIIFSGCASPEFASGWREARKAPTPPGIEGAWEGTWLSEHNGHEGQLRCLVSKSTEEPHAYDFHYWASWANFVSGNFAVTYHVVPKGDGFTVSGESDLGPFGVFSHEGLVSHDHFRATYRSPEDQGVFEMRRPD